MEYNDIRGDYMEKFVDRTKELETLEKEFCREESSFVVVYGRRRVGKTALINHFCKGKNAIYFLATEEIQIVIIRRPRKSTNQRKRGDHAWHLIRNPYLKRH